MQNTLYFPSEMVSTHRWALWKRVQDNDHVNKIPWDPVHWHNSKSNEPTSWCSFKTASRFYHMQPELYGGPAFFVGNGWCLLDLDDIYDLIKDYQARYDNLITDVMNLLDGTYCEVSTSGKGLHFIFKVDPQVEDLGQRKKRHDPFTCNKSRELYFENRFIALTGNQLPGHNQIKTITQDRYWKLYKFVFGYNKPKAHSKSDAQIHVSHQHEEQLSPKAQRVVQRILNSSDGEQFKYWLSHDFWDSTDTAKMDGVKNFDHSSEDLSCCNILAYWTQGDPALIDEIFRHTGLYRPKWNESRGSYTYGDMTIIKAIAKKSKYFSAV